MNDEQLKLAAIQFCNSMGLSPDELVPTLTVMDGERKSVNKPRWENWKHQVKAHYEMNNAIALVSRRTQCESPS